MDLPEWFDLDRRLARLQEVPIPLQFGSMNLRPGLDEPLLRLREAAIQTVNRVNGEHRRMLLVVGVKVRTVVLHARLDEHANDDPEKPGQLGHLRSVIRVHHVAG
jgi:hypothetical protein